MNTAVCWSLQLGPCCCLHPPCQSPPCHLLLCHGHHCSPRVSKSTLAGASSAPSALPPQPNIFATDVSLTCLSNLFSCLMRLTIEISITVEKAFHNAYPQFSLLLFKPTSSCPVPPGCGESFLPFLFRCILPISRLMFFPLSFHFSRLNKSKFKPY